MQEPSSQNPFPEHPPGAVILGFDLQVLSEQSEPPKPALQVHWPVFESQLPFPEQSAGH